MIFVNDCGRYLIKKNIMILEGNENMVETTVKGSPVVGCTNRGLSDVDLLTDEIVSEQLTRYFHFILEGSVHYDRFGVFLSGIFLFFKIYFVEINLFLLILH